MSTPANFQPDDKRARLRRLQNADTGLFLHLSGCGEVKGTSYAWAGTVTQAEAMRCQFRANNKPFPYQLRRVPRDERKGVTHV